MGIDDLIAQSNPQIQTQQGDTLDEIQQRRQLNRLALMKALQQPTYVNAGQNPVAAWAPIAQQFTGMLADRRLGKQEQTSRQQYNQQLANVLSAAKGTPDQTIEKPIPGPVRPGIDKPLGNTTETIPGKPGSFQDVVQAMIGSGNPQLQQTGLQGMLSSMAQNEAMQRNMQNEAYKQNLQTQSQLTVQQPRLEQDEKLRQEMLRIQAWNAGLSPNSGGPGNGNGGGGGNDLVEAGAKALADYTGPVPSAFSLKSPLIQRQIARAKEINPDYDVATHQEVQKAIQAFGHGKQGDRLRNFNVGLNHIQTMRQLVDALNNGDTQAFNKVANMWSAQTGQPAPTNLETAKNIVGNEIVNSIVGASGGVTDREHAAAPLSTANSPAQLKGALDTYENLMVGQLQGLKQQYEASTHGRKDFETKYLTPRSRSLFDAHASDFEDKPANNAGKILKYNPQTGGFE